jgi:hypothetical protein
MSKAMALALIALFSVSACRASLPERVSASCQRAGFTPGTDDYRMCWEHTMDAAGAQGASASFGGNAALIGAGTRMMGR